MQYGRAEKRLYRAFRRMLGIRRITPTTSAHPPYALSEDFAAVEKTALMRASAQKAMGWNGSIPLRP